MASGKGQEKAGGPPSRRSWAALPGGEESPWPPLTSFEAPPGSKIVPREITTPVHQFASGKRKCMWRSYSTLPPRIYLDQVTIMREISDVTQLRRGDHCMVTLNVFRCLHPRLDYLVSLAGALELVQLYHHFIVTDDVSHVDANGVPMTKDGAVASIIEYANTIPEFLEEVRVRSRGSRALWPLVCLRTLLHSMARCHRGALADYGDMPHIFRVEESLSEQDRERIVRDAETFLANPFSYNIVWSNCEHSINLILKRKKTSPEVRSVLWNVLRYGLSLLGLAVLHVLVMRCNGHYCLSPPMWVMIAYYLFTAVPVVLQSMIMLGRLVCTTWRSYQESIISRHDLYHILTKESCRTLINGFISVCIFRLATMTSWHAAGYWKASMALSLGVVFAYLASDLLFGLCSQVVVRLLMRLHGRFWLHGGSPLTRNQERALREQQQLAAKKQE